MSRAESVTWLTGGDIEYSGVTNPRRSTARTRRLSREKTDKESGANSPMKLGGRGPHKIKIQLAQTPPLL